MLQGSSSTMRRATGPGQEAPPLRAAHPAPSLRAPVAAPHIGSQWLARSVPFDPPNAPPVICWSPSRFPPSAWVSGFEPVRTAHRDPRDVPLDREPKSTPLLQRMERPDAGEKSLSKTCARPRPFTDRVLSEKCSEGVRHRRIRASLVAGERWWRPGMRLESLSQSYERGLSRIVACATGCVQISPIIRKSAMLDRSLFQPGGKGGVRRNRRDRLLWDGRAPASERGRRRMSLILRRSCGRGESLGSGRRCLNRAHSAGAAGGRGVRCVSSARFSGRRPGRCCRRATTAPP